jgi:hypothetical protein
MADMSAKLTPWNDGDTVPGQVGVFQTRIAAIPKRKWFQCWDGVQWGCYCANVEQAARDVNSTRRSDYQNVSWRGLASNPAEAKS